VQYFITTALVIIRRHVAEGSAKASITSRLDEHKLDDQHLLRRLDEHDDRNRELPAGWHLHFKQVLQDVDHLRHCRVQQEDPRQQRHVNAAQQHTDHVSGHRVPVQADNLRCRRGKAQTPEEQANQRRQQKSQAIEDSH
jgi:hypothetical protein